MPILREKDDIHKCIDERINLVAAELLVFHEKADIFSDKYLKFLEDNNILVWINSIKLDNTNKHSFYAGCDDDTAILNDGKGWDKLIEKGVKIIQTDWPYFLDKFRNKRKNK